VAGLGKAAGDVCGGDVVLLLQPSHPGTKPNFTVL